MNASTEGKISLDALKGALVEHIKTFDEKKQVSGITHAAHAIDENLGDKLNAITKAAKKAKDAPLAVIKTKCAAEFEKVEKTAEELAEAKENLKDAAKMNAGEQVVEIKTIDKATARAKMNAVLGVFGYAPIVERVEVVRSIARITDNPRTCALARIEATEATA